MNKWVNEHSVGEDELRFFPLEGLLPAGQALSVNTTYLILSLVSTHIETDNPMLLNALSKLHAKLHPFGLGISLFASSSAYSLLPLSQISEVTTPHG